MKNTISGLIIGGLITASVLGVTFGANSIGSAAANDKPAVTSSNMMQSNQTGNMNSNMMNSSEAPCGEMTGPEAQKAMKEMMQQPQMQSMMKQMLSSDPEFKQMMSDLITSADTPNNEQVPDATQTPVTGAMDHNAHHMAQ